MKNIFLISIIGFLFFCCEKKETNICSTADPITQLDWLNEIVSNAESDTTGNYQGSIYVEENNGKQVIFVDMTLGSGGVAGYWYNCDGSTLPIDIKNPPKATKKNQLYTNINQ